MKHEAHGLPYKNHDVDVKVYWCHDCFATVRYTNGTASASSFSWGHAGRVSTATKAYQCSVPPPATAPLRCVQGTQDFYSNEEESKCPLSPLVLNRSMQQAKLCQSSYHYWGKRLGTELAQKEDSQDIRAEIIWWHDVSLDQAIPEVSYLWTLQFFC